MKWLTLGGLLVFATLPSTSNYQLNSYGFGSGGTANASTSTYALEGNAGGLGGNTGSTSTYQLKPGFVETQQAHVPKIASFDNGSGVYYNKLHFVIDTQGNPTDALYALSISTDNFGSNIRYVKSDLTVGTTLTLDNDNRLDAIVRDVTDISKQFESRFIDICERRVIFNDDYLCPGAKFIHSFIVIHNIRNG